MNPVFLLDVSIWWTDGNKLLSSHWFLCAPKSVPFQFFPSQSLVPPYTHLIGHKPDNQACFSFLKLPHPVCLGLLLVYLQGLSRVCSESSPWFPSYSEPPPTLASFPQVSPIQNSGLLPAGSVSQLSQCPLRWALLHGCTCGLVLSWDPFWKWWRTFNLPSMLCNTCWEKQSRVQMTKFSQIWESPPPPNHLCITEQSLCIRPCALCWIWRVWGPQTWFYFL